jgi:hypothetical protein
MQRLSGYWQQLLGILDTSQREGGGILEKEFWLKHSLKSCILLGILDTSQGEGGGILEKEF